MAGSDQHIANLIGEITHSSSDWRAVSAWSGTEPLPAQWALLSYPGSLTQQLRRRTGSAFHVRVLKETGIELGAEDAGLLGLTAASAARLREVYLCGQQPLVFGRTFAPDHGAAHWLASLGAQPLGDRVFAEQDAVRSEIEVRQLAGSDALYHDAVRGLVAPPSASLWARRSVLNVGAARLLIYEVFLPGVAD